MSDIVDPTVEAAANPNLTTEPTADQTAAPEQHAADGIAADAAVNEGEAVAVPVETAPVAVVKPRQKRAPKGGISALDDMDIDFENFSVENDRALDIRARVEKMKTSPWIEQWKLMLAELGRDETAKGESPSLPGLLPDQNLRLFTVPAEHVAAGFSISLQGQELKVHLNDKILVEISFLPKEDEFAVFSVAPTAFEELERLMAGLETELKQAKSAKSARGSAWKERFSKS